MKRMILAVLSVTLVLNILFPWVVNKVFGFVSIYQEVAESNVDFAAMYLSVAMILLIILIVVIPCGNRKIDIGRLVEESIFLKKEVEVLFFISIIMNGINALINGFDTVISGGMEGKWFSYLQMFLDMRVLLFLVLCIAYQQKSVTKLVGYSLAYASVTLLQASRSGLFWLVLYHLFLLSGFKISKGLRKKIIIFLAFMVIAAPLVFILATVMRYGTGQSIEAYLQLIVGRLSYLEVAGIEIEKIQNSTYNAQIMAEKYGIVNQLQQAINAILPGDIFPNDEFPNQYWRAVFAGWSIEGCRQNYTSMYMIFPVYLAIKYGYLGGIILFLGIMLSICYISFKIKDRMISAFLSTYFLYTMIQFFDWAYHIRDLFAFATTFALLWLVIRMRKKLRVS